MKQGIENLDAPDFQDQIYSLHEFASIASLRFNLGVSHLKRFIKTNADKIPGVVCHLVKQYEYTFCNHETVEWLRAACRDQVSKGMPLRFVSTSSTSQKGKRHGPK